MSTPWHNILASVAVGVNGLLGTDPAELEATYNTRPLTVADFNSSAFPMSRMRDSILNAQEKLVQAIGKSDDRVLRRPLQSLTAPLASGALLPQVDAGSVGIIGNFGSVLDSADQTKVCQRTSIREIQRRLRSSAVFILPAYNFALLGERILHTRANVVLECCVYDAATQTAAFDANDDMLLPDSMAEALIAGGSAGLFRDDEFLDQVKEWRAMFAATLTAIPPALMEDQAA